MAPPTSTVCNYPPPKPKPRCGGSTVWPGDYGPRASSGSIDQLRADVFLDLLQGRSVGSGADRGTVDITVDLGVLAGLSEAPGELNGYGPVIADIARQVAREQTTSHPPGHRHRPRGAGVDRDHQEKTHHPPDPAGRNPRRRPVFSRDVGCPPPNVTSTTPEPGPKADPPPPTTSPHFAATITGSNTPDGK